MMKKTFSLILSVLLTFSVIFAAPDKVSLISDAATSAPVSRIINTYDDADIFYKAGQWNYWTRYSDSGCTKAIDSGLKYPAFANGMFTEDSGTDSKRAFCFTSASHSGNAYPVALRIYDSNAADKRIFVPEKNTTYTMRLKYKLPQKCSWADLYLNIGGMTAKSDGFAGEKLTTAVAFLKSEDAVTNIWLEAETTFTTGNTDYEGLGLFFATGNSASINIQLLIDNVEITKAVPEIENTAVNTYDDEDIYYKVGEWNYWTRYSDSACTKAIDSFLSYPAFANGAFVDGGGKDGSRAFRFNGASHSGNAYPVALRIYDSNAADKRAFVPEKNASYKIKLKYNVARQCDWANLILNIDGMMAASDRFSGKKLSTLLIVPASGEDFATNTWQEIETIFTTDDTDYEGFGLFYATDNSYSLDDYNLLIDDIEITKVCRFKTPNAYEDFFFYSGDRYEDVTAVSSTAGLKFGGWYLDEACTQKANGFIFADIPVFIKWIAPETVDFDTVRADRAFDLSWVKSSYNDDNTFGLNGSSALRINEYGAGGAHNSWPRQLTLTGAGGKPLQTVPGHTYRIRLSVKEQWRQESGIKYTPYRSIYFSDSAGEVFDWKSGCYANNQGKKAVMELSDYDGDTGWVEAELIFTEKSNSAHPIVMVLYQTLSGLLIDNFSIVDTTVIDTAVSAKENDVNFDGSFNIKDLVRIKKMFVKDCPINKNADVCKEENTIAINSADLAGVRKLLLGETIEDKTDLSGYGTRYGRTLVWHDEFESDCLNPNKWSLNGSDRYIGIDNQRNIEVSDSMLNIKVSADSTAAGGYTTGNWVTSQNSMSFKYGYLEMRAKLPFVRGAGPAFWLVTNTPEYKRSFEAEFDIFETFGTTDKLIANIHKWDRTSNGAHVMSPDSIDRKYTFSQNASGWHIYGYEWTPEVMVCYVDEIPYATFPINENNSLWTGDALPGTDGFHRSLSIILSNVVYVTDASDGPKYTSADTVNYLIDYVRLYQKNGEVLY